MNAYKITTKNFNNTFVVATNAENAIREFNKVNRAWEKQNGTVLKLESKEIVRVKFVGDVENV